MTSEETSPTNPESVLLTPTSITTTPDFSIFAETVSGQPTATTTISASLVKDSRFGFEIPVECPNVPSELLLPRNTWESYEEYDETANKLVSMFNENFVRYSAGVSDEVNAASPKLE